MRIEKSLLLNYVNSNIAKFLIHKEYEVKEMAPSEFLTSNRIDILVKYLYAKSLLSGKGELFFKSLYLDHIKAFNGFVEADDTGKIGQEEFDNSFKGLLESIQKKGLDDKHLIPINDNRHPIDGAHRISIALALGLKVKVFRISNTKPLNYDLKFFRDRGMLEYELDYIAEQYASIKQDTYLVMVWPIARGYSKEIETILSENGSIVYYKEIRITMNGMINLQRRVYQKEGWTGSFSNDFEGVWIKASQCYNEEGKLRIYLFESSADLIAVKEKIRSLFNIGKHAVHINDTHEETVILSSLLFNNNSISYLNSSARKDFKKYQKLFLEYVDAISGKEDDFAIIGGVMSEFGVRETNDLDYITTIDDFSDRISNVIEKENKKINYINLSISDLIYNPQNYFKIDKIKFVSPVVLLKIKTTRNNDSDKEDVIYLKKILNEGNLQLTTSEVFKRLLYVSFYRRKIKMLLLKLRFVIYSIKNGKIRKSDSKN